MSGAEGDGPIANEGPPNKHLPPKKQTIEKIYQKKSQLEHILLRPDTYIGSVERVSEVMWVYDDEKQIMIKKTLSYVPGLYKIFDEILVNAADNKQRDKKMDCIKVEIDSENNVISVWNNGQGIPVVMHKEENMYVPTMIFGHLLTSSNYNDEEEKVTGGRNGYGAKLCNIFSTKFTVETACKDYKKQFKQTWGSNMTKTSEPKIKEFFGDDFTKITFTPDLSKFKMNTLEDDIVQLMSRRAYDVAASTRGVKVFLNGKRLPVKNFKDYVDLYIKNREDEAGNTLKCIYENPNERWEVALALSDIGFQQVSFVNSIATTKGGRHVDYIVDMIVKQLIEVIKKKNKGGVDIKPFKVKEHIWVFVNCLIVNPTFDSQTKEHMTLQIKNFGSKCQLSEKFINATIKSGIVESVLSWAKSKAQNELQKTSGKKQTRLKGIPKLEDANEAGSKNAMKCTLILTEGDSAKALAVSGLGVVGRDYYGVFPLRGKLLNVREATHKQILDNAEINSLIKILGLQYKKKYNTEEDMKSLRYGKVMIMADQDQDGSHIKGLVINFIHHSWPELLRQNFLEEFITPIVKASKKKEVISFYSLPEFEEWKSNTPNNKTYNIKYYKGLGTSSSLEAKEYFSNMARHRIRFRYTGQQDDDHIVLAFSKKHIEHRKEWLTNFMVESKRRKEIGLPEKYLYTKDTRSVSYTDFVNLELVLFSNGDNVRSIPSLVDGLKPSQRKVLFTCFKRNDKKEIKVAQLAGLVASASAYHHNEANIAGTIVNLAQNFVGSNNINLLEPRGQFGTRLKGGKDCASARYIFTKMSPITRLIFHPQDDPLLQHEYDDNQKVEPVWYIPIIPMLLVNGAEGIGTGWMTKIPNYNPRELVANIRRLLDNEEPVRMLPFYKNFKGTIEDCGDYRYVCSGEIAVITNGKLEITELPVGTWTQIYKENTLELLLYGSEKQKAVITDYKEYNTDTTVRFVVSTNNLEALEKDGIHKVFKLQNMISISSMCVFDELGCLRRFESVMDILQEFFTLRLKYYQKRKDYVEGILEAEAAKLSHQARFIMEKCSGQLVVENKKRKTIVDELIRRGYPPDPVHDWKSRNQPSEEEETQEEVEDEEEDSGRTKKPEDAEKLFKKNSDVKKFDYLLGLTMWMLTDERKNELLRQKETKLAELETLKRKTPSHLWREDLDIFIQKLDELEEKERRDEAGGVDKIKESKKMTGKKKNLNETLPSSVGQRVVPVVSDDLKKKVQAALKLKENRNKKGVKKENIVNDEERDEFDEMVKDKKTIKDKLGTPDEVVKKVKAKKGKDGFKQTKLNFRAKDKDSESPKKRGRNKKVSSDSEDEDILNISDDDDVSFSTKPTVSERATSRRQVSKPVKYTESSDEDGISSGGEPELFDNDAVKDDFKQQSLEVGSSGSDNEVSPPPKKNESSEDLFDSLLGRKKSSSPPVESTEAVSSSADSPVKSKKKRPIKKFNDFSDSDDNFIPPEEQHNNVTDSEDDDFTTRTANKKTTKRAKGNEDHGMSVKPTTTTTTKKRAKATVTTTGSDDDFGSSTKSKKTAPKKKKKSTESSDEDFGLPKPAKKKAPAKSKSKKKSDDDSDIDDGGCFRDYSPPPTKISRVAKKQTKYVFSDDDLSD
ncbi:DNA topoisomerase 2 [Agrilus planipennis]|uniref:DNA topoisomerase 2 n=1 Tax=Agrilus planipennis TaxID=224129 RepID=A0A1W4WLN8_AGRPL|nr:DNA topoisomerase 2 [Agrilus planipennis]